MPVDKKLFELLIDRVKDYALFILDPAGHVMTWNAGARAIKGYTAEDIVGQHFSVFYTEDAKRSGWPQHELKVAMREGRFEDEGWRVRKDGSRFWANVVITALRDENGKLLGYSKITRDLSARRMQEEALRRSEERFRLLIEGVSDYAIYMLDPDGVVSSWNVGAQNTTGYSRDEIIGRHFSQFYVPEDIQAGKPWEELATARRVGRAEDEGWRLRKNGEKFWARVVVNALYDAEGRLYGFAKVTQDLTERQQARELERTAQHVNEFIAMLAHELRNPLAPIRNAVHVMDQQPHNASVQEAMRRTIDRQAAHLTRIVDDMLDISRITRGSLVIERDALDVADVVARAVEITSPALEEARHTLSVDLPKGPLPVEGDIDRLTQLLANLLTNAVRFTPPGGRILVTARREGEEIIVSVSDNGRGIAAADLRSIFGMFVQGKEAIHRIGGGLGIGLALARRIAELHGGSLEAYSEGEGKGSEFTVCLPAAVDAAIATEKFRKAEPPESWSRGITAKRVLVVDDNVDAANTLEMLLQSLGHHTRAVYDGPQALAVVEDFRPDIVLLDIGLPGISGYEVAQHLRAYKGMRMKIVAVTGWGTDMDRARSREAGFDLHLVKPVDELLLRQIFEANGNGNGNGGAVH